MEGTLFNSNDGDCSKYKGKYLEYSIRGQKFLDVTTGAYLESVVVAPGEKVRIAAPESGGHFRAYTRAGINDQGMRIAFWYPDRLKNGWWFSSGCKNGTRPSTNCDNGMGYDGEKSHSECKTLGDE